MIAHVSDLHCGSTVALCPPAIALDDGGHYTPSLVQRWIWQCWLDYWDRVAAVVAATHGTLAVVLNGDIVEGEHHKTTQILSGNPTAQAAVVHAALAVPLALDPSAVFVVRGTEAHVGRSGSTEESIALGLQKRGVPVIGDPETGTASWWHLRFDVHNTYFDVAHHGRTGQREHTRGGAAVLHAHDILLAHVKRRDRVPDLCLRGHNHRFNDSYDHTIPRVLTSGAWQAATAYVHKRHTDSTADVGGLIVVVTSEGYAVEKVHFQPRSVAPLRWTP